MFQTSYQFPCPSSLNTVDVRRIATDAVMRSGTAVHDPEIFTMRLVRQSSSIPVPAVRRVLNFEGSRAIVMDYIPGETLKSCWPRLGLWQRLRIIWTLRGYIRQLRRIKVPEALRTTIFPGPVASEPQVCYGPMFTEYVRPFVWTRLSCAAY